VTAYQSLKYSESCLYQTSLGSTFVLVWFISQRYPTMRLYLKIRAGFHFIQGLV